MKPTLLIAIALVVFGFSACTQSQNQPATAAAAGDPANGNLAPAEPSSAPNPQSDAAPAAPADASQDAAPADYAAPSDDAGVDTSAQTVEAPDPPPALPEYDQPACPGDDYLWTPGYWDYANAGYYWVPGAWVMSPYVGALWTPPWWGYNNNRYLWHAGYWGPHIGFYGGINYGFGYTGRGYYGAYWNNGKVVYNRSVTNVNVSVVHNVYNYGVPSSRGARVSYNGGRGGITERPTPQETAALRDRRTAPVAAQIQHAREASSNRAQFAAGGHPQPGTLVAAHPLSTDYRAPAQRAPERALAPRPAEPASHDAHENPPQAAQPMPPSQFGRPQATQPAPPSAADRDRQQQPAVRPEAMPHPPAPSAGERNRQQQPEVRPQPTTHPPAPSTAERIHQQPEQHPAPAARPTAPAPRPQQPESHADRMVRPEAPPHQAPPQEHPAPQQHPAPQVHPVPQVHQAPPEQHPTPPPPPKKKDQ
jgi:hypothetical protein